MQRENRNALLGAILAVGLAFSVTGTVYAISISGQILEPDFSGFNNAKVTAERQGDFASTRSSSSGSYSVGVGTTNWYRVDAMSAGWTHEYQSQVNGGTTGVTLVLDPQSFQNLDIAIAADEEFRNLYGFDWEEEAMAQIFSAEPWFYEEHSIDFRNVIFHYNWVTEPSVGNTCISFKNEMVDDIGWPSFNPGSMDMIIGITGEALNAEGCATNTTPSSHFRPSIMLEDGLSPNESHIVMHEITHTYDYDHQCVSPAWYDIMQSFHNDDFQCVYPDSAWQIKNWKPVGDNRMQSNRGWY